MVDPPAEHAPAPSKPVTPLSVLSARLGATAGVGDGRPGAALVSSGEVWPLPFAGIGLDAIIGGNQSPGLYVVDGNSSASMIAARGRLALRVPAWKGFALAAFGMGIGQEKHTRTYLVSGEDRILLEDGQSPLGPTEERVNRHVGPSYAGEIGWFLRRHAVEVGIVLRYDVVGRAELASLGGMVGVAF